MKIFGFIEKNSNITHYFVIIKLIPENISTGCKFKVIYFTVKTLNIYKSIIIISVICSTAY